MKHLNEDKDFLIILSSNNSLTFRREEFNYLQFIVFSWQTWSYRNEGVIRRRGTILCQSSGLPESYKMVKKSRTEHEEYHDSHTTGLCTGQNGRRLAFIYIFYVRPIQKQFLKAQKCSKKIITQKSSCAIQTTTSLFLMPYRFVTKLQKLCLSLYMYMQLNKF